MADNLTIKTENIKEGDPCYCWVNIEPVGIQGGRFRIKRTYSRIIIKNIPVSHEFQRRGAERKIVDLFKDIAGEIIAEGVRSSARGFRGLIGGF
ncbi:MAG: hypothetical protein JRJ42_11085 [Deltaproteobacteria bacterium]|nr:hypothetical protein [Deltaproteobacteria bacterium]MBW2021115.1 hypothetical protein [Deltaproteobacteria bacterium]MBW2075822.1 hypothetical protein [Deltaproteobacteria bacterium]